MSAFGIRRTPPRVSGCSWPHPTPCQRAADLGWRVPPHPSGCLIRTLLSLQQHYGHALDTLRVAMVVLGSLAFAIPHIGLREQSQIVASAVLSCGGLVFTRAHDSEGWFLGGECGRAGFSSTNVFNMGEVLTETTGLSGVLGLVKTFWFYQGIPVLAVIGSVQQLHAGSWWIAIMLLFFVPIVLILHSVSPGLNEAELGPWLYSMLYESGEWSH